VYSADIDIKYCREDTSKAHHQIARRFKFIAV